jgi:putative transposase
MLKTLFEYRDRGIYLLHEFVIMPDHLHLLLTPGTNVSLEKAMQFVKGGGSHRIHKERVHKMQIWQEGFFDWTIRDADDYESKVQYIRMNPARARLVERAVAWPYSSANPKFVLDSMPQRLAGIASGAEAPISQSAVTPGLKPRPPKESPGVTARRPHDSPRAMLGPIKEQIPDVASGASRSKSSEKSATTSKRELRSEL